MSSLSRDTLYREPSVGPWGAPARLDLRWLPLAWLAAGVPFLFAPSTSPISTFVNQWLAFVGAALWLLVWSLHAWSWAADLRRPAWGSGASTLVLLLLLLALAQCLPGAPWGQRIVPAAALCLAAALAWSSACAAHSGDESSFAEPLMLALLSAGLLSVVVGVVQVFRPEWATGDWMAYPTTPGRAVGNMRQPNQLATLLMWAMAATVWLGARKLDQRDRQGAGVVVGLLMLLVLGVVLTASRTGTVGILLLVVWGAIDRRLPGWLRLTMISSLAVYAIGWWALDHWMAQSGEVFYGDDQVRKTLHGDASSSRGRIWRNTLAMIQAHLVHGVGPGAFNFYWTMTPFADRPVAFFDHSHNLVLQWLVEFGVPLGVLLLVLGLLSFVRGADALVQADEGRARSARTAWFMLIVIGVHSLLEYPLWYVYFLLPTALIAGWALGLAGDQLGAAPPASSRRGLRPGGLIAALALVGAGWAGFQYYRVVIIFEPRLAIGIPQTLPERIAAGRASLLFGHHADYAEVTMAAQPEAVFARFERPLYHLLDTRLMIAYARALAARGEDQRARHVAARLREFGNPASIDFFAPCKEAAAGAVLPFQCGDDPRLTAEMMWPGGP